MTETSPTRQTKPGIANPVARAARMLGHIAFAVLLALMAALVFFLVQSNLTGGTPGVAGYQMYVVLSGSMRPTFDAGSVVFVRPVDAEELAQGDIITYRGSEGSDTLVTHRIVGVNRGENLTFTTRGDANNADDPEPVPAEEVIGRVQFAVPYAGHVVDYAQTKEGLLVLVIIPGALIIVTELRKLFKYATALDKEREARKQLQNRASSEDTIQS